MSLRTLSAPALVLSLLKAAGFLLSAILLISCTPQSGSPVRSGGEVVPASSALSSQPPTSTISPKSEVVKKNLTVTPISESDVLRLADVKSARKITIINQNLTETFSGTQKLSFKPKAIADHSVLKGATEYKFCNQSNSCRSISTNYVLMSINDHEVLMPTYQYFKIVFADGTEAYIATNNVYIAEIDSFTKNQVDLTLLAKKKNDSSPQKSLQVESLTITYWGTITELESNKMKQELIDPKNYLTVRVPHPTQKTPATESVDGHAVSILSKEAYENEKAPSREFCSAKNTCTTLTKEYAVMEINGKELVMPREALFEIRFTDGKKFLISAVDIEDQIPTDVIIIRFK